MCTKFTDRLERSAILKKQKEPKSEKIFYPTGNKLCWLVRNNTSQFLYFFSQRARKATKKRGDGKRKEKAKKIKKESQYAKCVSSQGKDTH